MSVINRHESYKQAEAAHVYYNNIFPADIVHQFYTPSLPQTDEDEFAVVLAGYTPRAFNRIYTIGDQGNMLALISASDLRQRLARHARNQMFERSENGNGKIKNLRYDVEFITTLPVSQVIADVNSKCRKRTDEDCAFQELRFDIDVTDYKECRNKCQCHTQPGQLCTICTIVAGGVGTFVDQMLSEAGITQRCWVLSGNRGLHCWVRDYSCGLYNNTKRTEMFNMMQVGEKQQSNLSQEALSIWKRLESRIGCKLPVRLDQNVTIKSRHAMRGIFSVHDTTQRVAVPIGHPSRIETHPAPLVIDLVEQYRKGCNCKDNKKRNPLQDYINYLENAITLA